MNGQLQNITNAYISGETLGVPAYPAAGFEVTIVPRDIYTSFDNMPTPIEIRRYLLYNGFLRRRLFEIVKRLKPQNDKERSRQEKWLEYIPEMNLLDLVCVHWIKKSFLRLLLVR